MDVRTDIASLLIDLEAIMRNAGLWSQSPPSAAALRSTQPFCVDTLELAEWLQFIFLPRMHGLLEAGAAMPEKCEIKPVVEEGISNPSAELLRVVAALDAAITRAD